MKANQLRYVCDKQCIGWKTHNICAHYIAVAEDNNELDQFLVWFASSKGKECNLTNAVYHGTYKHAGSKRPPRRKYGDINHLPVDHKTDRLPLCDVSNIHLQAIRSDHSYAKSVASQLSRDSASLARPVVCPLVNTTATGHSRARYGQNSTPNGQSSTPSNNTVIAGQNSTTIHSVGAVQPLQLCSTAQNVGTVNTGTATSQSLLPFLPQ